MAHVEPKQELAIRRIAALVLVNAMMFQEVLAQKDERVRPLQDFQHDPDLVSGFATHWRFILDEINYFPIFNIAYNLLSCLSADRSATNAVKVLGQIARRIVDWRASLRHDLAGRIYHKLLTEAKYLGAYYTSIPAAVLLAKLTLDPEKWDVDWSDLKNLKRLRFADLACGTGTLLMATADVIVDNHIRECAKKGSRPRLRQLHELVMKDVLYGFDVLQSAVHLTASTLALRIPDIPINVTNLVSLPFAEGHDELGSLDFLEHRTLSAASLFAQMPQRVVGRKEPSKQPVSIPDLDLCIMNPPFTSSRQPNLLFGSIPEKDRARLQKKLKRLVQENKVSASITAGLAAVFLALGDKYLKEGGRLALVLPRTLLSGVAWGKSRALIGKHYCLEYLIVSHEADRWNFSENTDLSEVLVVARKAQNQLSSETKQVVCVNLWRNPRNAVEALSLSRAIARSAPPEIGSAGGRAAAQLRIGTRKFGEALGLRWSKLKKNLWTFPCAFAQSDLIHVVYDLFKGKLHLPGESRQSAIPLCPLTNIGQLGPDPRDVYDAFDLATSKTSFPALWGAKNIFTMQQPPNAFLEPLSEARKGRHLRKVEALWPKAARVLLTQRPWLKTKGLAAVRVDTKVLADVWWPFVLTSKHADLIAAEKALVLWLNSSLGILLLLAHREETRGAWVQFKKPVLEQLPVLDVWGIDRRARTKLAETMDSLATSPIMAFPDMAQDQTRAAIDAAVAEALGIPSFATVRELLSREPILCLTMERLQPTEPIQ